MHGRLLAVCVLVFGTTAIAGDGPRIVTPYGIGPVAVGMTISQAEKALGHKLKTDYTANGSEACGSAWTAETDRQGYSFMVEDLVITRIDVGLPGKDNGYRPITTAEGIGVGSTEAAVRKAYGKRLKIEPHPYLENEGHYLIVKDPDGKHGVVFETDTKTVTSFRTGIFPAVGFIEGCA